MPTLTIFGIKSCDTMKKAFKWLDGKKVSYTFHDFKKGNLTKEDIEIWMKDLPIDEIINKKGTTWKKCTDEEKNAITNPNKAIELILKNPSIVKRPLVQIGKKHLVGFNPEQWDIFFS